MKKDPFAYTRVVTDPPKPELITPFDDLLLGRDGRRIDSASAWSRRRAEILDAFGTILGSGPKKFPEAEIRELSSEKAEGFTRRKITLAADTGEVITAHLCVPDQPLPSRPAVLCLPETNDFAHEIMAYGAPLARAGFVTLSPDHFVAGERTPAEGAFVTAGFYRKYPEWSAVGKTVWDHQICLNYLETLKEVDPRRIGTIGHSLGAHSAVFLAAMDARIACVVSNCGLTSFRVNPNRCQWSRDGWYIYFPTLRAKFLKGEPSPVDFHELTAALAPRPFLDISSLSDPGFEGMEHLPGMFVRVHEVYRLLGVPEKFAFYTGGDPHGIYEPGLVLATAWLKRWLS